MNTPEEMMNSIIEKMKTLEEQGKKIEEIKTEISEIAASLKEAHSEFAAKLSTKDGYNGKFYSIKSRYNNDLKKQITFVCSSPKPFGSWLKKNKKNDEE